jgi:hypothetical protein
MRKLIVIAACVLLGVALPSAATAGAVQLSESFTDEPISWFMGEFACTGKPATVAGTGLESGSVRITETPNGGAHVRLTLDGDVDLYEATGSPDDPKLGAYVGTWTYSTHLDEQIAPGGQQAISGATRGPIVFADGSRAILKISFHVLFGADGPKLFFAKAACGGE